ncbi:F-box protein CPR1-like [Actinidia eriantha]|uniref:F-box protein CPR1-like n=1 Tax=Actinidia eriantha TaxID=165200 RepID=UPI00258841EE|nr:F-box protein CPR1-like [Actinidia eriantha]
MSMESPNFPIDVTFDILSRLPTKTLIQFRLASKPWLSLIQSPHFIRLKSIAKPITEDNFVLVYYESADYTKQYYSICSVREGKTLIEHKKFEFPFKSLYGYVRIVGSSNGLVCLFDTNFFSYIGTLILWNVIVGKFIVLPDSHATHRFSDTFSHMVVGFGFVLGKNDFKVVQILYDCYSDDIPEVLVYSMEADLWRKVDAVVPGFMPNRWSSNVFVKGSVHWLAFKRPRISYLCNSIMSFDMSDEVFSEIALPRDQNLSYDKVHLSVSASGDSLSLFFHINDRWEAWSMKEYGVAESWMKEFTISETQISMPLNFMDNGDVLLVMESGKLVSCDLENQQMKDLGICGLPTSFCMVSYTSGLILLDRGDKVLK